jgi:hypothetical protein
MIIRAEILLLGTVRISEQGINNSNPFFYLLDGYKQEQFE